MRSMLRESTGRGNPAACRIAEGFLLPCGSSTEIMMKYSGSFIGNAAAKDEISECCA